MEQHNVKPNKPLIFLTAYLFFAVLVLFSSQKQNQPFLSQYPQKTWELTIAYEPAINNLILKKMNIITKKIPATQSQEMTKPRYELLVFDDKNNKVYEAPINLQNIIVTRAVGLTETVLYVPYQNLDKRIEIIRNGKSLLTINLK